MGDERQRHNSHIAVNMVMHLLHFAKNVVEKGMGR